MHIYYLAAVFILAIGCYPDRASMFITNIASFTGKMVYKVFAYLGTVGRSPQVRCRISGTVTMLGTWTWRGMRCYRRIAYWILVRPISLFKECLEEEMELGITCNTATTKEVDGKCAGYKADDTRCTRPSIGYCGDHAQQAVVLVNGIDLSSVC